jgi:hypothetical protein
VYQVIEMQGYTDDIEDTESFLSEQTAVGAASALKVQAEDLRWELYIHTQIASRKVGATLACPGFLRLKSLWRFSDRSLMLMEHQSQGTLQSVIQGYQKANKPIGDVLVAFFGLQMMRIVSELHRARMLSGRHTTTAHR